MLIRLCLFGAHIILASPECRILLFDILQINKIFIEIEEIYIYIGEVSVISI